NPTK
ncbi:hypothetical protein MK338_10640, partial [Streptococcus vestibularis]